MNRTLEEKGEQEYKEDENKNSSFVTRGAQHSKLLLCQMRYFKNCTNSNFKHHIGHLQYQENV